MGRGAFDEKWAEAGVRRAGAGIKNLNFGRWVPEKNNEKGGGDREEKWAGVGGLNPGGRGSRPHPTLSSTQMHFRG